MTNNTSLMNRWTLSGVDIHKNILMKSLIYHCFSVKFVSETLNFAPVSLNVFFLLPSRTMSVPYSMEDHDIFLFVSIFVTVHLFK